MTVRPRRLRPITPAGAVRRLNRGVRALTAADADLARIVREVGPPDIQLRPTGFPMFVRAILAQQVSIKAAETMYGRIVAHVGEPVTAEKMIAFGVAGCRSIGMTGRKSEYVVGLAEAELDGRIDFATLERMHDEDAIAALTALRGIGRWTAEVYLLLSLGRPDVWPAADLALIVAAGKLRGLEARPTIREAAEMAEAWRPWRGAAALLLWRYYVKTPA